MTINYSLIAADQSTGTAGAENASDYDYTAKRTPSKRAERTVLASPAVSGYTGSGAVRNNSLPGIPTTKALTDDLSPSKQSNRTRRVARQRYHMITEGGYLDYMQYYHHDKYYEILGVLERCHTSWNRERKGEDIRYRAAGCGRRFDCPLCGNYVQTKLAQDAAESMSLALTALDVAGVDYQNYGLKLVFTIPKETSVWIDELLVNNTNEWRKEVNRLRKKVLELCKLWFGVGAGYLTCLELTGESNPVEPHYHVSVYVFPARYDHDYWYSISSWTDKLDEWRGNWTAVVNSLYNLQLDNADFRYSYVEAKGQMFHWLRYMYRPILADLWRGWHYYDGVGLEYRYKKNYHVEEVYILKEDLDKAFDRARYIPKHFKRIRWAGIFADGVRAKTMESVLGLERIEKEDDNNSDVEGWVRDKETSYRLVGYESDGILLKDVDGDQVIKIPNNFVDYRPDMVRTGRRVRWCEPGGRLADKLVLHMELTTSACSCQKECYGRQ